jgi:hypothetical protein
MARTTQDSTAIAARPPMANCGSPGNRSSGFGLNPAQMRLLSGFIETYLKLPPQEETISQEELDKIDTREKETVMNIVTSWMEQGIAQEEERSRVREAALLVKLLRRNIGAVSATTEQAIAHLSFDQFEQLGDVLFDFASEEDLLAWLSHVN